uniref:Uncharacterized protein n=1 Tax=Strix occidentalis caurina TaxID=311401 RepID=A0A8D0FYK0_STROC
MDPNTIIEALRGTMDPALREAAERQLNEVRSPTGAWTGAAAAVILKSGALGEGCGRRGRSRPV